MSVRVDEFIDVSSRLTTAGELLEVYLKAVDAEGFQNAVFARAKDRRLLSIPWSRFPEGYLAAYQANEWDKIDPVVQHIHSALRPFRWSDLCERVGITNQQRMFIEECRKFGVHSGITIPLHGPGTQVELVSLSMRDGKLRSDFGTSSIYAVTVQYWSRFGELGRIGYEEIPHLTGKEIECLKW